MSDQKPALVNPTRYKRSRKTRGSVLFLDKASYLVIVLGGISTILAVSLVMFYLIYEVLPLFIPAEVEQQRVHQQEFANPKERIQEIGIDDQQQVGWRMSDRGVVASFSIEDGEVFNESKPFAGDPDAVTVRGNQIMATYPDGRWQVGTITVDSDFLFADQVPDAVTKLELNEKANFEDGVIRRISQNQFRKQSLHMEIGEVQSIDGASGDSAIDHVVMAPVGRGHLAAMLIKDNTIYLVAMKERVNLMTRKKTISTNTTSFALSDVDTHPIQLVLSRSATNLLVIWDNGTCQRYDLADLATPQLVETANLLPGDSGITITTATTLLGDGTVMVGDDQGRVRAWFLTEPERAESQDGRVLRMGHDLEPHPAAVTAISTSTRMRQIAVSYADGFFRVINVTNEAIIAEGMSQLEPPLIDIIISPKDDGLLMANANGVDFWTLSAEHPDVSFTSLFTPVWYESFNQAQTMWQSTGATDAAEPKLGLWPLIFGTLKATVYAMLFAIPVAIGAAIFSSEFLPPSLSRRIKPVIELMASLPSVVLGFIAGLELAPIVERALPMTISTFIVVPLVFVIGGHLWQLMPRKQSIQMWRPAWILLSLPIGLYLSWVIGTPVENLFFDGNIRSWLSGPQEISGSMRYEGAIGGWLFLTLPAAGLTVAWLAGRYVMPWMDQTIGAKKGVKALAHADLLKIVTGVVVAFVLALAVAAALSTFADARGSYVDTFSQRNALVVGVIMGFAVIPLIYTISEDALKAVPNYLRAASLGCGATPWQTAVRIIVPTATSGLFSAIMIGLGRAVGETMIVLMATGNTPVKDWNIFNGMRTLSANIAVELPEAPIGSSHYRILFLTGLLLFLMTFVLNTAAELVRQRFRKRALQL